MDTNKIKKAFDVLFKGKKMPIGTVSNGRKKVAEGKWIPVKKEGQSSKKELPEAKKSILSDFSDEKSAEIEAAVKNSKKVEGTNDKYSKQRVKEMFGKDLSNTELVKMGGGILNKNDKIKDVQVFWADETSQIKVYTETDNYTSVTGFKKGDDGKINCEIVNLVTKGGDDKRTSIAAKLVANRVKELRGKDMKLTAYCAKDDVGYEKKDYLMYAKLGFELKDKDKWMVESIAEDNENNPNVKNAKTLQDLMATNDGQKLWSKEGGDFTGEFDMSKNSKSIKALKKYLK